MSDCILLIEDNSTNRQLMHYLLTAFKHNVISASDGKSGVELAKSAKPSLILCDIQLPDIDGYEVLKQLRESEETNYIPVVAVTAFAMVGDKERVLKAGFDGYLSKPIEPERFVPIVEGYLPQANPVFLQKTTLAPVIRRATESTQGTILGLDDNPANLDLLRALFEAHAYRVITTDDPGKAVFLAKSEYPGLIISDVLMPKGSGYDFLRNIKNEITTRDIPFVFLSSTFTSQLDRQYGLSLGADKYLLRPIEPGALLQEIESLLSTRGSK